MTLREVTGRTVGEWREGKGTEVARTWEKDVKGTGSYLAGN